MSNIQTWMVQPPPTTFQNFQQPCMIHTLSSYVPNELSVEWPRNNLTKVNNNVTWNALRWEGKQPSLWWNLITQSKKPITLHQQEDTHLQVWFTATCIVTFQKPLIEPSSYNTQERSDLSYSSQNLSYFLICLKHS